MHRQRPVSSSLMTPFKEIVLESGPDAEVRAARRLARPGPFRKMMELEGRTPP
jgi:hypothetical protein